MLRFGSHRFGSNRATHLKSPKNRPIVLRHLSFLDEVSSRNFASRDSKQRCRKTCAKKINQVRSNFFRAEKELPASCRHLSCSVELSLSPSFGALDQHRVALSSLNAINLSTTPFSTPPQSAETQTLSKAFFCAWISSLESSVSTPQNCCSGSVHRGQRKKKLQNYIEPLFSFPLPRALIVSA